MDREKVIDHLQIMHTWATFALEKDQNFFTEKHMEHIAEWTEDAIALLKKDIPIVPIKGEHGKCPICGYKADHHYCPNCGQQLNWEE